MMEPEHTENITEEKPLVRCGLSNAPGGGMKAF
jgi:hypothetical protein